MNTYSVFSYKALCLVCSLARFVHSDAITFLTHDIALHSLSIYINIIISLNNKPIFKSRDQFSKIN